MALIGIGSLPSTERSRPPSISSQQGRRKALQHRLLGPSRARAHGPETTVAAWVRLLHTAGEVMVRAAGGEPATVRAGGGQSGKASDLLPSLLRTLRTLRSITHGNTTVSAEVFPTTLGRSLSGAFARRHETRTNLGSRQPTSPRERGLRAGDRYGVGDGYRTRDLLSHSQAFCH